MSARVGRKVAVFVAVTATASVLCVTVIFSQLARHARERELVGRTLERLEALRPVAFEAIRLGKPHARFPAGDSTLGTSEGAADPTGLTTLVRVANTGANLLKPPPSSRRGCLIVTWREFSLDQVDGVRVIHEAWGEKTELLTVDGWGRSFVYRSPGPVHTRGWDLYSFGPNGRDDEGGEDDVVFGEDW